MSPQIKAALGTYGRALLACLVTAVVTSGVSLADLHKADVTHVLQATWVAFLPVLIRALNPHDKAYGVGTAG
mgnify:CR=1 FL=1